MSNARPKLSVEGRTGRAYKRALRLLQNNIMGLPVSKASGIPVRKPWQPTELPPLRGSFVDRIAVYCAPCAKHGTPRLHSYPREDHQ